MNGDNELFKCEGTEGEGDVKYSKCERINAIGNIGQASDTSYIGNYVLRYGTISVCINYDSENDAPVVVIPSPKGSAKYIVPNGAEGKIIEVTSNSIAEIKLCEYF